MPLVLHLPPSTGGPRKMGSESAPRDCQETWDRRNQQPNLNNLNMGYAYMGYKMSCCTPTVKTVHAAGSMHLKHKTQCWGAIKHINIMMLCSILQTLYIIYRGCGMHSTTGGLSLNHGITSSLRLGSTHNPKSHIKK